MCFGIRCGRFYDEVGLAGIRVTVVGRTAVPVASCEFFTGSGSSGIAGDNRLSRSPHAVLLLLVVVKVIGRSMLFLGMWSTWDPDTVGKNQARCVGSAFR